MPIGSGFNQPFGVAVDAADDVFVADYNNHRVVELSSPTVDATPSRLLGSTKVAVAAAVTGLKPGTTYYDRVVADTDQGTVVDVKSPPQSFTTKATTSVRATGTTVKSSMTALGIGSGFSEPTGVAVDAAGDVFVADTGKNAIKEILPNGTIKTIGSHFKARVPALRSTRPATSSLPTQAITLSKRFCPTARS